MEIIQVGQVEIRFLLGAADTGGALSMFQFTVPPAARVPIPHSHIAYDETIFGIEGVITFTVAGEKKFVGPGDTLFIPRGAPHGFINSGAVAVRSLAVITPALLSPDFFREAAAAIAAGGPPDPKRLGEIMLRHGLKPEPAG